MSDNETLDVLSSIHALIAKEMLRKLESGEAEAKDWAVIIKFLQQNGIDAMPKPDDPDDALAQLMRRAQESIGQYQ